MFEGSQLFLVPQHVLGTTGGICAGAILTNSLNFLHTTRKGLCPETAGLQASTEGQSWGNNKGVG